MKSCTLQTTIAVCCLMFLFSCKKNDICLRCIPPAVTNTQIARYYGDVFSDSIRLMGTINYDKRGNPVSIIKESNSTGNADCFFHYDKKGRLSDYIEAYSNPTYFEIWHFYTYDNQDRVVVDSIFSLGEVINGRPANYYGQLIASLKYDLYDRIINYAVREINGNMVWTESYVYDLRGNRNGNTVQYDNFFNPRLLHKVWQLIDRDYSINNALTDIVSIQYNEKRFPTYMETTSYSHLFLQQIAGFKLKIEYSSK